MVRSTKGMVMVDMRCPRCNEIINTDDINMAEVQFHKVAPFIEECMHCKQRIKRAFNNDPRLPTWYYDYNNPAKRKRKK